MAERKNTHGLTVKRQRAATVIDIGDMEIWDGADLSLIRDTLTRLISKEGRRSIAVQMRTVKYVPSGFFGMLYDWWDQGISVRLISPQPRVSRMLWFQRFFELENGDCYVLREDLYSAADFAERDEFDDGSWDLAFKRFHVIANGGPRWAGDGGSNNLHGPGAGSPWSPPR